MAFHSASAALNSAEIEMFRSSVVVMNEVNNKLFWLLLVAVLFFVIYVIRVLYEIFTKKLYDDQPRAVGTSRHKRQKPELDLRCDEDIEAHNDIRCTSRL